LYVGLIVQSAAALLGASAESLFFENETYAAVLLTCLLIRNYGARIRRNSTG
jgi:hypothetical protein